VAPKTLLAHWEKELRVCGMGRATYSFYGSSEGERSTVLTTITRSVCSCVRHVQRYTSQAFMRRTAGAA
jgi:hypothetical protein